MLSKKVQGEIVTLIVDALHPLKIILFGSYAYGNPAPDSDVDLIVVTETPLPKRQTSVALWNLLGNIPLPKDIIVTSREEFEFYSHEAGSVMRTPGMKGNNMNKNKPQKAKVNNRDTLQPEYDFSKAVRGVTAKRYAEGTNVVVIPPELRDVFPDSATVAEALRALAPVIRHQRQLNVKAA